MNKISGVQHICLKAAGRGQWEHVIDFYTRVLGCPQVRIAFFRGPAGESVELFQER